MKKFFILFALLLPNATLASFNQCVNLGFNSCTSQAIDCGSTYCGHDWATTCTTSNGNSVAVRGIATCAANQVMDNAQTEVSLDINSNVDDNKYCWCKMVYPAVSTNWVSVYGSTTNTTYMSCTLNCADWCAGHFLPNGGMDPFVQSLTNSIQ